MVEIVTFYLLKTWGFQNSLIIERALAEYGNPEITHNVEYSLHPILREYPLYLPQKLPLTASHILAAIEKNDFPVSGFEKSGMTLLTSSQILRNSCIIAKGINAHLMATLEETTADRLHLSILEHYSKPYAMFECKRVGIEETSGKGPQTIEKAKQGAYVAKAVSSLHKVRISSGELRGLIYKSDQGIYTKPYTELLAEIVHSDDPELLSDFILTVGVVSNHGNWFTSDNHNKELKVLAQSYDWLVFLTDEGLVEFITGLLLDPEPSLMPVRRLFEPVIQQKRRKINLQKSRWISGLTRHCRPIFGFTCHV